MSYKRILTIQDISCVGQCSLTVALPLLSVCGHETAILPSSVLSNHTYKFSGWTFRDLSRDMPLIKEQWKEENIDFDGIYTGYMGSKEQIDYTVEIIDSCLKSGGVVVIDPAMADNGKLYPGFDDEFVTYMKKLAAKADYLLPNITEACLLTDTPYTESYDEKFITELMEKLCKLGCKNVVLTGIGYKEGSTGAAMLINGVYSHYRHEKMPFSIHGTGDVFASVFTGALMKGKNCTDSVKAACSFTLECMKETRTDPNHWYGPKFEPALPKLIDILKQV